MFAQIVVNMPVEGTYHYHIPPDMEGRLEVGHLVEVPFGRQKVQGIVLGLDLRAPVSKTKPIERIIDHRPVINEAQLALAHWLSETYLAPLSEALRLFIPPGLSKRGDVLITPLIDPTMIDPEGRTQSRLLTLLAHRGPLRGRQIARSLPKQNWRDAVSQLVERGLLMREPMLDPPSVQPKQVRVVDLAVSPTRVEQVIEQHFSLEDRAKARHAAAIRRSAILRLLASERRPLAVGEIYAAIEGSTLTDLRVLLEDDLIALRQEEIWRDPLDAIDFTTDTPPRLTPDQARVWEDVKLALDMPHEARPILLHGVTGSGKTEIYLRAVEHVLQQGQTAIVLVPEIALTPQTVRRFGARFPGEIGLIHSQLSKGERYDTWRRARSGQISVVVGPRSALFAPLDRIGLIVIDECHDDSYKQEDSPTPLPYYHALDAARELTRLHGGLLLMGSATPNVTTYARAARPGGDHDLPYTLLELPGRIMGHRQAVAARALHYRIESPQYTHRPDDPEDAVMIDLPPVQVVDMRQELRAGNRSIFSRALIEELSGTLERSEQAILFLNRRGTSTYVFCRNCGHVMTCPNCDTPLTWHQAHAGAGPHEGTLVCHQCNHQQSHPEACPECGSDKIRFFGGGTERVEQEVRRQFPQAQVTRWDTDTTGGKDSHIALLKRFVDGEASILIGTQMVAKGLDLPLVTLVGVISADTALYLPDYRSGERTFQLLTQVAGRAGRGLLGGKVILQTYAPEHYAIQAAARHDFHTFYEQELRYRGEIQYPPYSRLLRILIREEDSDAARQRAQDVAASLAQRIKADNLAGTDLVGPAPCFYARRDGLYRWHIIIRGINPAQVVSDLSPSRGLQIDVDPVSLL